MCELCCMNNLFYFITDCKPFFFFLWPIFILNILLLKCVDQAQILQELGEKNRAIKIVKC